MPSLHNAAMYLFFEDGVEFIRLDEPMFPDPIISAPHGETFEAMHILMCADTGSDPAYVSVRPMQANACRGANASKLSSSRSGGCHADPRAGRPYLQLYRTWSGRIRQTRIPSHTRESAAFLLCCGNHIIRTQPALPMGRVCAVAENQGYPLRN